MNLALHGRLCFCHFLFEFGWYGEIGVKFLEQLELAGGADQVTGFEQGTDIVQPLLSGDGVVVHRFRHGFLRVYTLLQSFGFQAFGCGLQC